MTWQLLADVSQGAPATTLSSGVFSSIGFKRLLVELVDISVDVDGTELVLQVGFGATPTFVTGATDYRYGLNMDDDSGTLYQLISSTGAAHMRITDTTANVRAQDEIAGRLGHGTIWIYAPDKTVEHRMSGEYAYYTESPSLDGGVAQFHGIVVGDTNPITAVRIATTANNIDAGDLRVYGLT